MLSKLSNNVKTNKGRNQILRPVWVRAAIVLFVTILYVVTLRSVIEWVGPVGAALITLPVVLTGFFFGVRIGLTAGVLGVVISTILLVIYKGGSWITWGLVSWPGNLLVIASGYTSGLVNQASADRLRVEEALSGRERFLSLITIVTKNILEPERQEDTQDYILTNLTNLFVGDYGYLVHWDEARKQAILVSATLPLKEPFGKIVLEPEEADVIVAALQSERTLVIDNMANSPYVINPSPFKDASLATRAALVIPLVAGKFRFGAAIIGFDSSHRFSRDELIYAELASNQIALALWTAQQNTRIAKKLKEAVTLANIERILSETEQVGLETILQTIVDSAKDLIPQAQYAVLHILDVDRQILIPSAVAGFKDKTRPKAKSNMRLGEGIAGQAIAAREIISVPDTEKDTRFVDRSTPAQFRSLLVAPIQSNERCVGAISVQSEKPYAFTEDESQLLGALGTQAAIAIENSSLLETTQRDLKEINALYQISQHLAASLDPDELMKNVVDLLAQSFEYYHVQIFVVAPENSDLVMRQGSGQIGEELKKQNHRLPVGSGIVGHTAETNKSFVTNNSDEVVFFLRNPLLPDTKSEMTIPIRMGGKLLGVLDIQQTPPNILTGRDMQLMVSVADQLAVALQKANLYTELQESLHQEQATRQKLIHSEKLTVAGRLLASVSHELNNPLQAIQNALFLLREETGLSTQGKQDLEIVLSEAERMATLLERLRVTYQRTRLEDFQPVQINNVIEDIFALVSTHLRHNKISFEFCAEPSLPPVPGLADQLRQVILNLFLNAVDAMSEGGHMVVATSHLPDSREVLFTVTDNGRGIEPDLLPNIFDAFITNKESGTGLGLTICYEIVLKHRGRIKAENNPGGGATFSVWLPLETRGEE